MKWIQREIQTERRQLERARRRFVDDPCEKTLHDVRTTARRLRSFLEDVACLHPHAKLARRIKRTAAATDTARDQAVLLTLLESTVDSSEAHEAGELLEQLREGARRATRQTRRKLQRLRFA